MTLTKDHFFLSLKCNYTQIVIGRSNVQYLCQLDVYMHHVITLHCCTIWLNREQNIFSIGI